ncbi:MAG: DUF4231 domain-containing protein [Phormidesmis sp.]
MTSGNTSPNISITSKDLPGLYQSASQASREGQKSYFRSLRLYLLLLIAAACFSLLPESVVGAIISAVLFLVTLLILIAMKLRSPDAIWYNGRALAESVKTRAWRWMMRAKPYTNPVLNTVENKFIDDLEEILKANRDLSKSLSAKSGIQQSISQKMRDVRGIDDIKKRLNVYERERIDDQAKWYSNKSEATRISANHWFTASVVLHLLAIVLLIARIPNPELKLPIEAIATAAGAALTWLEAKKYRELTSSYSLAAHEISLIKARARSVQTENDLADFVLSSENAFSREHAQ